MPAGKNYRRSGKLMLTLKNVYDMKIPAERSTAHIKSLDTGHKGAVRTADIPRYTGTKIKGIGTMHKSNAVPIFSDEEARDIASMRR
jgi:hypothetical protein